ncbi:MULTISPECIES: hypothetical protein [unclassified Saccharicrinis]|uniref:hypothetical protein n=1 Tax=unclassified Saccharicrinis TaxID=2646859 RepID=UPI003D33D6D0
MKVTKVLFILIIAITFLRCDSDDITGEMTYNGSPFVRFFLLTNSNNEPFEAGDVKDNSETALEEYTHESIKPLKIPVVLTYPGLDKEITVEYSSDVTGNFDGLNVSPANLSFGPDNFTDTITVNFNKRWNADDDIKIDFVLVDTSDENVNLGHLNSELKNKNLALSLGTVNTSVSFSDNRKEIDGLVGERIEFEILFNKGFLPEEVESLQLFDQIKEFDYVLERELDLVNFSKIKYILTLNENINDDDVEYTTKLKLVEESLYQSSGNSSFWIVKPIKIPRDKKVFTASNFYNLSDPYYRTYGENWMDYNSEPGCEWTAFNTFTYPLVVPATDSMAVLYSDNGTSDTNDDVYHHAFKVGFYSPNAGRTVNSFNLKRWFTNDYTDEDKSPGFNIRDALEFFPKDGTSASEGIVKVTGQELTISNKTYEEFKIEISGSGTYQEVSEGLFEIILVLKAYSEELFGGTRESHYRIYNKNSYGGDPEPLSEGCFEPQELVK